MSSLVGKDTEQDVVGCQLEPCLTADCLGLAAPWCCGRVQEQDAVGRQSSVTLGGALVLWPALLFPNRRG